MKARGVKRIAYIAWTLTPDALASLPVCASLGNSHPLAAALCRGFASLGPAFIKLGQFLSVRPDLVGDTFASEMAKLRDRAPPLSYRSVETIIKEELGRPPEILFKEFDREPVASASVSQVHRAITHEGVELAIKVQRPDAGQRLGEDLELLHTVATLIGKLPTVHPHGDPAAFVERIMESAREETDFRVEGEASERFRLLFRREKRLKIPRVYWEYTTRRMLATEFIHGWKISDPDARSAPGYEDLAETGALLFFRQVLEYGHFHADLHPSNVFVTDDGRIAYLDFGIRGEIDETERKALLGAVGGMLARDEHAVLSNLATLGVLVPARKAKAFAADVRRVLETAIAPSLAETSTMLMGRGIMLAVRRHGVQLPHKYALLVKALLTVEGSARTLHSTFNMEDAAKRYFETSYASGLGIGVFTDIFWRFLLYGAALESEYPCQTDAAPI